MTGDATTRYPEAFDSRAGARWAALRQRDLSGAQRLANEQGEP